MISMTRRIRFFFPVLLALMLLLAACGIATPVPTQSPTAIPTPAVTSTSTAVPARLVYVTSMPADSDPNAALISDFTAANDLQYIPSTALDASLLTNAVKIVVLQTAPADLGTILNANPNVQFVLLSSTDLASSPNLSIITSPQEDLYFMAGYLATLTAYDWRSAGLLLSDSSLGAGATDAFVNGGKYMCGKCNPSYPPLVDLPQVASLPASSSSADWLAAVNGMLPYGVNVMYVDPSAATPEVLSALSNAGVTLVGLTPPPSGVESNWGGSLTSDASGALQQVLEDAIQGKGGQTLNVPVTLSHVNPALISPARQDLFNQTAAMLAAGQIGALSIP